MFIVLKRIFDLCILLYSDDTHDDDIIFEDFARLRLRSGLKGGEADA